MMKFKLWFVVICFSAILFSCKKEDMPPVITLTSPSDTTVINGGDTVLLQGTLSDDKSLHEAYFSLVFALDSSVLFIDTPYVHGLKTYPFGYEWITSISGDYIFTVKAEDHDNHTTIKQFPITVH